MKTTQTWKIGDCLQLLPEIPDKSIDMILTDLPYGTTACKWDITIPFEPLWEQYERIIKDNGAIILFASQPFTSILITSNLKLFKYEIIWNKPKGSNFVHSKYQPLKTHENICVFSFGGSAQGSTNPMKYYPQLSQGNPYDKGIGINTKTPLLSQGMTKKKTIVLKNETGLRQPRTSIYYKTIDKQRAHPTQKPLSLFEYLIQTYTNEGDTVHDSCLGSGTTLEACANLNRNCIGFELLHDWEEHYRKRLKLDNTKLDAWTT